MASVDISSIVSVICRWIGSIMHFASSSREWMTSLRFIRFSHLGQHGLRGSVGGSVGVSGSCASSTTFGSVISRTENRLLLSNGGARLTRCRIQNSLHYLEVPLHLVSPWMLRPWRQTYSPIPFLSHPCPCIGRRNGGRTPLPNVRSFCSASRCREWPWSSVPRLCPSGQGYPETGWSG